MTKQQKAKGKIDAYIPGEEEKVRKTLRFEENLCERMEKLAAKKKTNVNALVVAAMKRLCDEEGV